MDCSRTLFPYVAFSDCSSHYVVFLCKGTFFRQDRSPMSLAAYTREEVKKHNTDDDCWVIYRKNVYKLPSEFIFSSHPGGPVIMEVAGVDATIMFDDGPHGESSQQMLKHFLIGVLSE